MYGYDPSGYQQNPFLSRLSKTADEKHKVFISYYHADDEFYRNRFEELFGNIFINKSVKPGDIDSDNSDDYIKTLIREDYISDASVLIVLIGPKTYCRKHIDWEIYAGLDKNAGVIGLCLPEHSSYNNNNIVTYDDIPERLKDNHKSGYVQIYDWTTSVDTIKKNIQYAFDNRIKNKDKRDFSLPQYKYNRCD